MIGSVKKLANFTYGTKTFDFLYVITDENGSPPILPLLYSTYLSSYGVTFGYREVTEVKSQKKFGLLDKHEVSNATIRSYIYKLAKFLNYLETCRLNHGTPGMHASTNCSEKFVNHYLNYELPQSVDSYHSLDVHCAALTAYFNWLDHFDLCPRLNLKINRVTRQEVAAHSRVRAYIQYVPRYARHKLVNACETLSEKLIMRLGFEVGLRTSEVAALRVLGDGKLLDLFLMLNDNRYSHYDYFKYYLEGKFTKGGKSRWIYFERDLLNDMKRYYETERKCLLDNKKKPTDYFLLRRDNGFQGQGIGKEHASRIFRKRAKQAKLNELLHFHDLRHTFATELFHSELMANDGRETRSESAALITVAQRLGHAFNRDGRPPETTVRYIRMRIHLMEMENEGI